MAIVQIPGRGSVELSDDLVSQEIENAMKEAQAERKTASSVMLNYSASLPKPKNLADVLRLPDVPVPGLSALPEVGIGNFAGQLGVTPQLPPTMGEATLDALNWSPLELVPRAQLSDAAVPPKQTLPWYLQFFQGDMDEPPLALGPAIINQGLELGQAFTSPAGVAIGKLAAVSPTIRALVGLIYGTPILERASGQLGEASVTGDQQQIAEGLLGGLLGTSMVANGAKETLGRRNALIRNPEEVLGKEWDALSQMRRVEPQVQEPAIAEPIMTEKAQALTQIQNTVRSFIKQGILSKEEGEQLIQRIPVSEMPYLGERPERLLEQQSRVQREVEPPTEAEEGALPFPYAERKLDDLRTFREKWDVSLPKPEDPQMLMLKTRTAQLLKGTSGNTEAQVRALFPKEISDADWAEWKRSVQDSIAATEVAKTIRSNGDLKAVRDLYYPSMTDGQWNAWVSSVKGEITKPQRQVARTTQLLDQLGVVDLPKGAPKSWADDAIVTVYNQARQIYRRLSVQSAGERGLSGSLEGREQVQLQSELWKEIERRLKTEWNSRGMMDLSSVKPPESLMPVEKTLEPPKPKTFPPSPIDSLLTPERRKTLPEFLQKHSNENLRQLHAIGLLREDGSLASSVPLEDAAKKMASNPDMFGKDASTLMDYLVKNFPETLRNKMVNPFSLNSNLDRIAHFDANSRTVFLATHAPTSPVAFRFLHETAHACWNNALHYPKSDVQRAAANRVTSIMQQAEAQLPPEVRKMYKEEWKPLNEKETRKGEDWEDLYDKLDELKKKTGVDYFPIFHSLTSPGELLAVVWEAGKNQREGVRNWFNSWQFKETGKSAWTTLWTSLKELLGVKQGTALDAIVDSIQLLKEEKDKTAWEDSVDTRGVKPPFQFQYNEALRTWKTKFNGPAPHASLALLDGVFEQPTSLAPTRVSPGVKERTGREYLMEYVNAYLGKTLPKLSATSTDLANLGAKYASARIAVPLVADDLVSQVLGKHFRDKQFSRTLGDILIEDRLRAIRQGWEDAANKETDLAKQAEYHLKAQDVRTLIGAPGYSLHSEAQFQALMRNPEFADAIQRHRDIVQRIAGEQQVEVGGDLARPGPATGAFVNLMAVFSPDDINGTASAVYMSRKGDITNPLQKGSVFNRQAKGSGDFYLRDYRVLGERMIKGNYEQAQLRRFYDALIEQGLAVEEGSGVRPPTFGKLGARKIPVQLRRSTRNLWIREDVADEVRHLLAVDDPVLQKGLAKTLCQAATELQVVGATDAVWHSANMLAAILTAQGGKNIGVDIARKMPGLNLLDATARVVHEGIRVALDSKTIQDAIDKLETKVPPAGQLARAIFNKAGEKMDVMGLKREKAQIAEIGAGRSTNVHSSLLTKAGLKYVDPSFYTSSFIRVIDQAGRLALNKMFDNLVQRGIEDTSENRREFINRMGQYNERLMPRMDAILREAGVSSFVVAGKNFNRLAMQRFLFDPGVEVKDSNLWWKMHAVEALGAVLTIGVLPALMNYGLTKTWTGRPGTPPGAIDTGKDDEQGRPIVIDLLQLTLWRRALRITGAQAAWNASEAGKTKKDVWQAALKDIYGGWIHPYAGPAVRTAKIAASGRDTSGYLLSKNPDDIFENGIAALKNGNPMIAAYLTGMETVQAGESKKKAGTRALTSSLVGATGIPLSVAGDLVGKKGKVPTFEQRVKEKTGKNSPELTWGNRIQVAREVVEERKAKPNVNELARRAAAIKDVTSGFAEIDRIHDALEPDVQAFLDTNKLRLEKFTPELFYHKTPLPLTEKEKQKFEGIVTEEYNKIIKAFIPYLPEEASRRQDALNVRLGVARNRARARFRRLVATQQSE